MPVLPENEPSSSIIAICISSAAEVCPKCVAYSDVPGCPGKLDAYVHAAHAVALAGHTETLRELPNEPGYLAAQAPCDIPLKVKLL